MLEEKVFIYFFETLLSKHYSCITNVTKTMFSSVQLLGYVRLFATPWTAARQASLSITNSWSLLKLMPIESVRPGVLQSMGLQTVGHNRATELN